ncbi:TRAP transporter large permease [Alkalihalobacillus oceani]|uniref:TRAP transporter large permease n=1 Tax=Halalkalibacter oceani TaxID=1653776 RepID=A0A9X2DQS9_9BACI|nr:TRAP transporter large permease [Halalkalibacter oceani]MCM3715229.1 TRAP transporter large permease [Halalkalibacter oceani]
MALMILVFFLLFLVLRVPVVIALGLSSLVYMVLFMDISVIVISQQMISTVNTYALLAIPFFIIAGGLMEAGGISNKIINFANAAVGFFPGGLALVMIVSSMLFASMSGSGVATAAALGSILIPAMVRSGYDRDFSSALQASSAIVGPLIPPSILAVLYAVSVGVSVGDLLLAGLIPGLIMVLCFMILTIIISVKRGYKSDITFSFSRLWKTFLEAIWALLMPVIMIGGIYSGIFTPTEAAAVGCLYSLLVGLFIYKGFSISEIPNVLYKSGLLAAGVMAIVATSAAFSWVITREGLPQLLAEFFTGISSNQMVFLFTAAILLLLVGCFLDSAPAVLIMGPILAPVALEFGVDPVHFGVIVLASMCIGLITPPIGLNLFVVSGVANRPIHKIIPEIGLFFLAAIISLILIILFPALSLVLLN